MNKAQRAAAIKWIADHDGSAKVDRTAQIAKKPSVRMLASVLGEKPEAIAAEVRTARTGRDPKPSRIDAVSKNFAMAFIERYAHDNGGTTPTLQEIADALDLGHASTAFRVVQALSDDGRVKLPTTQRKRGIEIVPPPKLGRPTKIISGEMDADDTGVSSIEPAQKRASCPRGA